MGTEITPELRPARGGEIPGGGILGTFFGLLRRLSPKRGKKLSRIGELLNTLEFLFFSPPGARGGSGSSKKLPKPPPSPGELSKQNSRVFEKRQGDLRSLRAGRSESAQGGQGWGVGGSRGGLWEGLGSELAVTWAQDWGVLGSLICIGQGVRNTREPGHRARGGVGDPRGLSAILPSQCATAPVWHARMRGLLRSLIPFVCTFPGAAAPTGRV